METFKDIKDYLIANLETMTGLIFSANNSNTTKAIYLIEKPESHKLTSGNAVIIKFNELNGGHTVRQYSLEIKAMAQEMINVVIIKNAIVKLLDYHNRPCDIGNYVKLTFSNEGGVYYDTNNNMYVDKLFFECKTV